LGIEDGRVGLENDGKMGDGEMKEDGIYREMVPW
jgi:hypothetical protein